LAIPKAPEDIDRKGSRRMASLELAIEFATLSGAKVYLDELWIDAGQQV